MKMTAALKFQLQLKSGIGAPVLTGRFTRYSTEIERSKMYCPASISDIFFGGFFYDEIQKL